MVITGLMEGFIIPYLRHSKHLVTPLQSRSKVGCWVASFGRRSAMGIRERRKDRWLLIVKNVVKSSFHASKMRYSKEKTRLKESRGT